VIWGDTQESGPALRRAASKAFCPVETYGFSGENDWIARDVAVDDEVTRFRLFHRGKEFGGFTLAATGRHNVLNATAAIAVAHGRGIGAEAIGKALATFRSVRRRMDVKGEHGGILVVDDLRITRRRCGATIEAARGTLAEAAAMGDSGATFEFDAAQSVSGIVAEGAGACRSGGSRRRVSGAATWR